MQRSYGAWLDDFRDDLIPGRTALDVGCGTGNDTIALASAGLDVVSLDLDPETVRHAASRTDSASFIVADLRTGIPLLDATFDLVVASLCLHYFDRATTNRIHRDVYRVAIPGSTLLARVNVVGDVPSLWGTGIEREQDFFEVEPGRFKRFFTESTLADLLSPWFTIDRLFPRETLVNNQFPKQTLVVRAVRRDG